MISTRTISKARTQYQERVMYPHANVPTCLLPKKLLPKCYTGLPLGCASVQCALKKSMYVRNSKLLLLSFPFPPISISLSLVSLVCPPPPPSLPHLLGANIFYFSLSLRLPFPRWREKERGKRKKGGKGGGMAVEYGKLFLPLLLLLFSHILG